MKQNINIIQKGWILIGHLFLCLVFFCLTRWGFYWNNTSYFDQIDAIGVWKLSFYGMRFDLSAIAMVAGIPFLLLALPLGWQSKNVKIWSIIFTIFMGVALCFEIADWKYFAFNQRRSNSDVLHMIARPGDFLSLLPSFLRDYASAFVFGALGCFLLYKISCFIIKFALKLSKSKHQQKVWQHILIVVLVIGAAFLGIRGGTQLVPLSARNAVQYTSNENIPLVINTTFHIITSVQNQSLQLLDFVADEEARKVVAPIHQPNNTQAFKQKNIVVIILESFSKEFTSLTSGPSYTPYLDSLMQHSYVFNNTYANAFQSAHAIPAILAGIPGWMDQSFMTSAYANNKINSFASLLAPLGYTSTFYHGATNGSMSFDIFTKNAGYQRYFGRKEYGNEQDYDGNWGIWDEPFLQKVVQDISTQKMPFHAAIFNLNSHHPYTIPDKYAQEFPEGDLPIYKSIRYSDYALQQFMKSAAQTPWFSETIFVFTADHCSPIASNEFYQNKMGKFQIPLFIYDPSQSLIKSGQNADLVQQIDILPTILDTLAYPKAYYALGENAWKKTKPYVLTKIGSTYFMLQDSLQLNFANNDAHEVYHFYTDSMNVHNKINTNPYKQETERAVKKYQYYLQIFTNDMINNHMIDK